MPDPALHSLLGNAMDGRGCPLCSVLDSMVFNELCRLQRHAVVDPETHADVVARGGYCADHFWYLDALASPVTNAELLAPLMDRLAGRIGAVAAELAMNPSLLRQDASTIAARLGVPTACRVCESMTVWQTAAIDALLSSITEPPGSDRYARSGGLCLPHLAQALTTCKDRALAELLLHAAVDHSRRLAGDLRTYVRKWKEKDRGWGPEDAAPRCSIEKLVGAKRQRSSD